MINERINEINSELKLIENKDSLTFGTDAYLLSAYLPKRGKKVGVELGLGSGVISLLALKNKKLAHVYGIEVQRDIYDIAKRNVELNGLGEKMTVINEDLRNVRPDTVGGEVDAVFTNPPYMKADSGKMNENEAKAASRHELFGTINDFCTCGAKLLKHGGDFYAVYRPDRMADLIFALKNNNLEPKRITFVHKNSTTPPSLLLLCAKKGGKSGLIIDPPLYIYKDGTEEYTDKFSRIYEECAID